MIVCLLTVTALDKTGENIFAHISQISLLDAYN